MTLIGYLRNLPSTRPFEVSVPDMITDREEKYTTAIDSLGRFTLRFPVLNSHNVFIDWGRTTIWTSVEPGETASPSGWKLVCVDGFGLGWGKLVNGTLKNKYPVGWRK